MKNNPVNPLILKILVLTLLLAACAPLRPLAPQQAAYRSTAAKKTQVVFQNTGNITGMSDWDSILSSWLGTPYKSGGNTKNGTDCSGFVSSVFMEKEGMAIPRSTKDEYKIGKSIDRSSLTIGDLVFFGERRKVNHVGIYVGNGNFIHASSSNGVMVSPLEDIYWKPLYIGAKRYL